MIIIFRGIDNSTWLRSSNTFDILAVLKLTTKLSTLIPLQTFQQCSIW